MGHVQVSSKLIIFPIAVLLQLLALLPLTTFAIPSQFPFTSPAKVNLLNTQADFDILSHPHPLLKNHSVRIRTPKGLCDPEVEQKSGYLDTKNGRHFYFWQFDSRNDPKNDPIVLWVSLGCPGRESEAFWGELTPRIVYLRRFSFTFAIPAQWRSWYAFSPVWRPCRFSNIKFSCRLQFVHRSLTRIRTM